MQLLNILLILQLFYVTNGYKYLVYNVKFGRSHTIYMNKLIETLGSAGHDVVNYQPIYTQDFNDTQLKHARTINRELTYPIDFDQAFLHDFVWTDMSATNMVNAFLTGTKKFVDFFANNCRDQLKDKEMMERLKKEQFDLLITEYFDPCGLIIGHRLGIKKHATIFSMPLPSFANKMLGLPNSLSFVPDLYASLTPKMTLVDRFKNVLSDFFMYNLMHSPLLFGVAKVGKEMLDPNFDFMEKAAQSSLVFVNTDEVLDFPRPITHKVVYIGGLIGVSKNQKPKQLPEALDKVFKESKRGVIYMSFGTVAPSHVMPPVFKKAFLEAFNEFKDITFLWKYEKEDGVAKNYSNVITNAWFPQQEILSHPKTLLFISHGGMNSLAEASYSGQPTLFIPLFADQFRNGQTAKYHGYGEVLDKSNLTKESLVENIRKIIDNESYREKAIEMSNILSSKPIPAKDLFVKNLEFATQFDLPNHLNLQGQKLSTIEYYNLDIFAIISAVSLISLYLSYRVTKFILFRCLFRSKKSKVE